MSNGSSAYIRDSFNIAAASLPRFGDIFNGMKSDCNRGAGNNFFKYVVYRCTVLLAKRYNMYVAIWSLWVI